MGLASDSIGLDLTGTTRAGAMVSDNIHRDSPGLEETGSLLTQGVGVQISEDWGRRSLDISLEGGWETLDSENIFTSDEIYSADLDITVPWSRAGRIKGTAETSREMTIPETDDPDEGRVMVKRFETGLLVANVASAVTSWQAVVSRRMEQSVTTDMTETTTGFQWERELNRVSTLSLRGTSARGDDDEEMDSWKTMAANASLENRIGPSVTRSYSLSWENSAIEIADGTEGISEIMGVNYRYVSERPSGLSHEMAFGFDLLRTPSDENIVEPNAELIARGPLSRVVTAEGSVEYSLRIQDPLEQETEWSREGRFTAGLDWSASRVFSVLPSVDYLHEDIQGWDVPDRIDRTIVLSVDTRWAPASTWFLELGAVLEDTESTEQTYELAEERLELRVSSTFQ